MYCHNGVLHIGAIYLGTYCSIHVLVLSRCTNVSTYLGEASTNSKYTMPRPSEGFHLHQLSP